MKEAAAAATTGCFSATAVAAAMAFVAYGIGRMGRIGNGRGRV
eukprot:CAMPEP_0183726814 /NCGR_PEP_ID=MMETSP0737-20130205/24273_1 /TAXON_ID=385413 /ORGANISM="Thalassiosira miniscula, Strain CCMP1093" /LENGTH=42 /DNA_ID= /DNA_START= /DNA_END= /DNA_ORIENTATION=